MANKGPKTPRGRARKGLRNDGDGRKKAYGENEVIPMLKYRDSLKNEWEKKTKRK